jgi:hypothetical protein
VKIALLNPTQFHVVVEQVVEHILLKMIKDAFVNAEIGLQQYA